MNVPWDFTIVKVWALHIFVEILKVHFDVINANVLEEKLWILSVESVKKLIVKLDLNQVLLDNVLILMNVKQIIPAILTVKNVEILWVHLNA